MLGKLGLWGLLLLLGLGQAKAYIVTVDAHAEECFFEHVEAGTKLGKSKAPQTSPASLDGFHFQA